MDSERHWKAVERVGFLVGILLAAATLYYTAGLYYGWNQPPQPAPQHPVAPVTLLPPWWAISLGLIGIAVLITSITMMVIRLRPKLPPARSVEVKQEAPEATAPIMRGPKITNAGQLTLIANTVGEGVLIETTNTGTTHAAGNLLATTMPPDRPRAPISKRDAHIKDALNYAVSGKWEAFKLFGNEEDWPVPGFEDGHLS